MTVHELNTDELRELKEYYFFADDTDISDWDKPSEIPDSVIFETHGGTNFVKEDFSVTFNS